MAGPFGGGGFGSFVAWEHLLGDLPLQGHGYVKDGLPPERRATVYGVRSGRRLKATGDLGDFEHDAATRGDIISGIFIAPTPKRAIGSWRWGAWPMKYVGGGKALPVFDGAWSTDERYKPTGVSLPPGFGDVPVGTPLLVVDAGKEDAQIPLAFPFGSKFSVVAQWRGKDLPEFSTLVHDITDKGELDEELHFARTDTVWRVSDWEAGPSGTFDPSMTARPQTLAWVLTEADPGKLGGGHGYCFGKTPGFFDDRLDFDGDLPPEFALGIASIEKSGPLSVGYGTKDPHFLFKTAEGLAAVPLAFNTEAAFHPPGPEGHLRKGPLLFEPDEFPPVTEHSMRVGVHLQFDPSAPGLLGVDGAWRWWSTTAFQPSMSGGGGGGGGGGGAGAAVPGSRKAKKAEPRRRDELT